VSDSGEAISSAPTWQENAAAAGASPLPVDVLLAALRDWPGPAELLVLDMTHLASDPWLGMFSNQFPHLLEEKLKAVNDSRLWVLAAAGPLECSNSTTRRSRRLLAFSRRRFQRGADKEGNGLIGA